MAIKFYTDEHVPPAVANGLRQRGIDVFTAQQAKLLSAPDTQHMEFAVSNNRVIFTQDADFLRLHASGVPHAGIVYAHQRTPVSQVIQGLILIYQVLSEEDMQNHVEFL